MAQFKWKMAQFKLYVANAIFSTKINGKWHNLNEKWHKLNHIWQKQYFQPKSMKKGTILMKNGTVQSRVKINEGEQYIVNLSKSRRISMVWLYYLISERTCCVFCIFFFRNEQCPARSALFVLSHVCLLKFSEKFQSGGEYFSIQKFI